MFNFSCITKLTTSEILSQSDRLFTMDTRALNHVLTHSSDYQKPSQVRYNLSRILGEGACQCVYCYPRVTSEIISGVLFVEGAISAA